MATRRRRTTSSTASIKLSRMKVGGILLGVGALFFFTLFYASESPIFTGLSYLPYLLFGTKGSFIFFGLLILLGFIILISPKYYTKRLFRFSGMLQILICGLLDFPLITSEGLITTSSANTSNAIVTNGGWIGYILLRGSDRLLGGQSQAIKIFVIGLLVAVVIAVAVYYKIKLPTIQLEAVKERFEATKKAVEKSRSTSSKSSKNEESSSSSKETTSSSPTVVDTSTDTLKSLIKEKLNKKIQQKDDEAQLKQMHMSFPTDKPTFDINLLTENPNTEPLVDEDRLVKKAQSIKEKLAEFNIDVDIEGFNVGPKVVQFKIAPQSGIKISKIESYDKDIALALRVKSLRILAPIPGTSTVGVEIPNPKPQMVRMREVLGGLEFTKAMQKNLTNMTIGMAIDGNQLVKPLEKMPHCLVAGATGSGKSVGVNGFITSLIYQNSPSELKFIMVDPKQVELGIYEGIPYLLAPIITDPDKAVKVLKWSVDYMEQRYKLLKDAKVRNLQEYNAKQTGTAKLYRLVIIIDELADLMMTGNKKDTETYIARIAQKARAVGIHLILATQRPSVNVITGLIKANVPTRIAFGMVSQIDSRTVLDQKGAEELLGQGDLLYSDPNHKYPLRIQGPFIDTVETENIIHAIKMKYMEGLTESDIYHPEIMRILESKGEYAGAGGDVSDDDEDLIEQAIEIIAAKRKASATMLQRTLSIGFPRAARLLDILEERGIVGPQEGAKPREILI